MAISLGKGKTEFKLVEINKKKNEKKKIKSIAVPRNLWQEVESADAWKTDLMAIRRFPFSLQLSPEYEKVAPMFA